MKKFEDLTKTELAFLSGLYVGPFLQDAKKNPDYNDIMQYYVENKDIHDGSTDRKIDDLWMLAIVYILKLKIGFMGETQDK